MKRILYSLVISITTALVTLFAFNFSENFRDLDNIFYDLFFKIRYHHSHSTENIGVDSSIVIVTIDDKSLTVMDNFVGDWPWPRTIHGDLIHKFNEYGAKTVFFDILFSERQLTIKQRFEKLLITKYNIEQDVAIFLSNQVFVDFDDIYSAFYHNRETLESIGVSVKDVLEALNIVYSDNDRYLIEATAEAGNIIYPFMSIHERVEIPIPQSTINKINESSIEVNDDHYSVVPWVTSIRPPIKELVDGAYSVNNVAFLSFIGDMNRQIPLTVRFNNRLYPHVDIAIYNHYKGFKKNDFKVVSKQNKSCYIKLNAVTTPIETDSLTRMKANLRGRTTDFVNISYSDLLFPDSKEMANEHKRLINSNIVMIGATAPILQDLWKTPLGIMPGVVFHANVVNSFLRDDILEISDNKILFLLILLITIAAGIVFLNTANVVLNVFIFIKILFIGTIVPFFIFSTSSYYTRPFPLLVSIAIVFLITTSYRIFIEKSEKSVVRKTFEKYVSSNIVKEILKAPEKIKLGGEKRTLSILFSDIRNFTTFSEKHDPVEIISRINEFFTYMTEIIYDNKGTLDKYVGDEIMALFGAPVSYDDHAYMSCLTAAKMIIKLRELEKEWIEIGKEPIDIGVGINTGEAVVGNIGSSYVMNYTVIGDSVNLAARVEALTRKYDSSIIITEFTYESIKEVVQVVFLDEVIVKGKTKPVKIYGLKSIINTNGETLEL